MLFTMHKNTFTCHDRTKQKEKQKTHFTEYWKLAETVGKRNKRLGILKQPNVSFKCPFLVTLSAALVRSNLFWKLVLNLKLVASQYIVLFPLSKLNTGACKSFYELKRIYRTAELILFCILCGCLHCQIPGRRCRVWLQESTERSLSEKTVSDQG